MRIILMQGTRVVTAAAVLALVALTTGCGPSSSGRPTVVASFYPLQFIADFVAGR